MKSKIEFKFDDRSLDSLDRLREQGRIADFKEIKITNPNTGEQRVLVLPVLLNKCDIRNT